jgi:hypothetical protein
LVGDANGVIAIASVDYDADTTAGTSTVTLHFSRPLPDDRFTLTVNDSVTDDADNMLDAESNADDPNGAPTFPSGDGRPGGDFAARFTVDTRPEIATYAGTSVYVDTNGNFYFDPENADTHNEDITYVLGLASDDIFTGNFSSGGAADGFDKIAAYGKINGKWRWLIDTNNNGTPDVQVVDPRGIAGVPVAGNFDDNAVNGDEVGLFTGTGWWLDTNHDFQVDMWRPAFIMGGRPLVGDFDGDGHDDLAVWRDDRFHFDLTNGTDKGFNGVIDQSFHFGFPGMREIPVAADMNHDGFEDVGLWAPDQTGVTPGEGAEWYFLVSQNDLPIYTLRNAADTAGHVEFDPRLGENVYRFSPEPFGGDFLVQFGDDYGMPLVGNFDPPVTAPGAPTTPDALHRNFANRYDVNGDGQITAFDALALANELRNHGRHELQAEWSTTVKAPYLDIDGDQQVSPFDMFALANYLRRQDRLSDHAQQTAPAAAAPLADETAASDTIAEGAPASGAPVMAGAVFSLDAAETAETAETQDEPFWFATSEDASAFSTATTPPTDAAPSAITAESADQVFADDNQAAQSLFDDGASDEFDSLLSDIADDVSAAWQDDEEDPLDVKLS